MFLSTHVPAYMVIVMPCLPTCLPACLPACRPIYLPYYLHYFILFRRLAMRHDTCALIAVSLNLSQRTHPVVWSLNNLPFDCSQVLAVPKPIGEFEKKLLTSKCDLRWLDPVFH